MEEVHPELDQLHVSADGGIAFDGLAPEEREALSNLAAKLRGLITDIEATLASSRRG
jgi:hypothetical protein